MLDRDRLNLDRLGDPAMRPFNIIMAVVIAAASSGPSGAQEKDAVQAALERINTCLAIPAEAQRLACYDAAAASLGTRRTAEGAVAITPRSVEGSAATAGDRRAGVVAPPMRGNMQDAEPYRVTATIERIVSHSSGRSRFYMSNGQVWTQVKAEAVRNVRAGDEVSINSASFGSFLMTSPRGGKGIRVRLSGEN
jgi:hypothetical protein